MSEPLDDMTRLAMFDAWDQRCTWCRRPLFFNEMEIEHLLPKSLVGKKRLVTLQLHGHSPEFDLDALENLAPSCGPCNRGKGSKPPPNAPVIALMLAKASDKAP